MKKVISLVAGYGFRAAGCGLRVAGCWLNTTAGHRPPIPLTAYLSPSFFALRPAPCALCHIPLTAYLSPSFFALRPEP
jgi:hypothetical protein